MSFWGRPREGAPHLPPGRIRDQCIVVLERIASDRPVLLLLDDVQWADPSTLDVLARLAGERSTRLAVIARSAGAHHVDGTAPVDHGWQQLQHDVQRRRGDIVLDFDAVAAAEARAFVDALLDREPNAIGTRLREELTERSEGHALFAVELIRELKENGSLQEDGTGRWITSCHIAWHRWPARIEGLLAEKFARLDGKTRAALDVACVEGEEFTADVVAAVQDTKVDAVVRRLSGEASERHHLVRAIGAQRLAGARVFRYRFTHNLYQRYLYDRLDEVRRPYLHERLASALEALGADAYEDGTLALAHHLERAGIPERALPYIHRAGCGRSGPLVNE